MIPILLSIIAGLSTLLGCIPIFIKIKRVEDFITISLSFSMTIMILVSIFDLIPESLNYLLENYNLIFGLIISILVFILGYLSIDLINNKIKKNNTLYKIGFISLISLMFHNVLEGIIVYMTTLSNIRLGIKICIAIILHNIPEGLSISIPLYYSGKSRGRVLFLTIIAALSEPLGALLSYIFLNHIINKLLISYMLLFVSGIMISLCINDIYIEIKNNNHKKILIGIILAIIMFSLSILI